MLGVIDGIAEGLMRWTLKNPMAIILVVLALAVSMIVVSKNGEIRALRDSINNPKTGYAALRAEDREQIATNRDNIATLQHTLDAQTAGLKALNDRAAEAGQRGDAMLAELEKTNRGLQGKMSALDAARPGADKCVSAFNLVRSAVK